MAFTAAVCSWNFTMGLSERKFQIISLLSLPPDASCWSSNDHLSPQTSYLWPTILLNLSSLALKSRWRIFLSLLPVLKTFLFQAIELTRAR